jgi:hypothetical protein
MTAPDLGPLPKPCAYFDEPVWTADQMRAYALQELAKERERIKGRLIKMDAAIANRHNYYAHAAWVLFGEDEKGG